MHDLILGIDVGTTTVKSAAYRAADLSVPVHVTRRPAVGFSPRPGWSEAEPDAVEAAAFGTVRELVDEVGADRIAAVGISGTACGAWLADREGRPVRPAILWNDGRAAEISSDWHRRGLMSRIFDISGNVPFPGYTVSVLAWLGANEPATLQRSARLLWCKDWLRWRLTGIAATDESEASYVPFDIVRRSWSEELFELAGVRRYRDLFPPLLEPRSQQPLTHDGARVTGLLAGTPVAVGATDIIAGVVGAGATRPGSTVTILGTSANSTLVADHPPFQPRDVGIMAASPLGRWARSMINTSGSTTLDWAARLLGFDDGDVSRLLDLAAQVEPGADGVILVPYLSPAGTVSPRLDPHATATLAGLRTHHGPAHVARAAVEGLALAVADCYASMALPVHEIVAVGGAAKSDLLLMTLANLTGRPVVRPVGDEFGARGVAVLAAWAVGAVSDLDAAAGAVPHERRFTPDAEPRLQGALERYRAQAAAGHASSERWA